MGVITWGGIKSSDLGIIVELVPDYEIPERNVTSSRSFRQIGDCLIDQKSFQTVTRTYHLAMVNKDLSGSYEHFANVITEWLMAPKGFSKLVEDEAISGISQPVYRMAYFSGGIELNNLYGIGLRAEIQFQCMPELHSDETMGPADISDPIFTIYNTLDLKPPYIESNGTYIERDVPKMFFNKYPKIRIGVNFGTIAEKKEYVTLGFYQNVLKLPADAYSLGFEIPRPNEDENKCCQIQADFGKMKDTDYQKFYNYRRTCQDLGYIVPICYNLLTNNFEVKVMTNGLLRGEKAGSNFTAIPSENTSYEVIKIPTKWGKDVSAGTFPDIIYNSRPEIYSLSVPASVGDACGFLTVELPNEMSNNLKYLEVDRDEVLITADKI